MTDSYKEQIIDFYKVRGITELGIEVENSARSVGWGKESEQGWSSEEAQYRRFEILYNIGATKDSTIIDYGCGLGHMIDFLKDKGHSTEKQYLGVDILEEFIVVAKKAYPGHNFITGDIYDVKSAYDYVLASGAFTICTSKERMFNAIKQAYDLVNKGIAFNLLHEKHLLSVNENFQTYNPEILLAELKKFYNNVSIVNNYLPNKDFTIYIKK